MPSRIHTTRRFARYYRDRVKAIADTRLKVIEKYGGRCACCGESEPAFLTVDRPRSVKGRSETEAKEYARLLREPRRKGLRLTCFNCKFRRAKVCPHRALP
jgi:hypothetical protein